MSSKHYDYSIRRKLVYFFSLSAIIALIISTTTMLVYSYLHEKESVINDSIKLAKVSGKNIAASLLFIDKNTCKNILKPILNDTNIQYIAIYNQNGQLFTSIGTNESNKKTLAKEISSMEKDVLFSIDLNYINILTTIFYDNDVIGYLEVHTTTNKIKQHMIEQALASLLIMLITIFIVILLAIKLEKMFLKPIFTLLDAMQYLRKNKDFDIELIPSSKDEFGELFNEFNIMAYEINKRDKILHEHNLDLELLVNTTNKELKTTQENLDKVSILATTDALTNLYNRRHIMDIFDEMIKKAKENKKHIGIIMLDIDHFKLVNDTLGHQAGDVVLKEVSHILQENAREVDNVGRIGGEEFLILCKESDIKTLKYIAERLRKNVEEKIIQYEENKTTQVKISLGIYSCIPNITKEELIKIADDALYNAKETGRNKVSIGVKN